jgi:hypothetical protein
VICIFTPKTLREGNCKMKICPACLEIIPHEKMKEVIIYTIGEIIKGVFYGDESYFYHKECVNN